MKASMKAAAGSDMTSKAKAVTDMYKKLISVINKNVQAISGESSAQSKDVKNLKMVFEVVDDVMTSIAADDEMSKSMLKLLMKMGKAIPKVVDMMKRSSEDARWRYHYYQGMQDPMDFPDYNDYGAWDTNDPWNNGTFDDFSNSTYRYKRSPYDGDYGPDGPMGPMPYYPSPIDDPLDDLYDVQMDAMDALKGVLGWKGRRGKGGKVCPITPLISVSFFKDKPETFLEHIVQLSNLEEVPKQS